VEGVVFTRYQVSGTWYQVPDRSSVCVIPGTRYLVPETWYLVPESWYLNAGTRYQFDRLCVSCLTSSVCVTLPHPCVSLYLIRVCHVPSPIAGVST
jgi:hypothetical protein